VYTYGYDHANRLVSVTSNQLSVSSYQYNGQGDRLSQTVDGVTTNYTLDLNGGLTQVLADGTNTYLYGRSRLAETSAAGTAYYLADALGSVRQLADGAGSITLARAYRPYGEVMGSNGAGATSYGFTGEATDVTGMVYLRARYYAPGVGRFISRDTWAGDAKAPMSYNGWLYTYGDPVNRVDPSGMCPDENMDGKCDPGWWCERLPSPQREWCLGEKNCGSPCDNLPEPPQELPTGSPVQRAYKNLVETPWSCKDDGEKITSLDPWWKTEGFGRKAPVDMTSEMAIGVMMYMEIGSLKDAGTQQEAIDITTEFLARRLWYGCYEKGACLMDQSVIPYPSGLHFLLSWSGSFMNLEDIADLTKADIYPADPFPKYGDPGWAYQLAYKIINNPDPAWKTHGQPGHEADWSNHPWGAFNPQTFDEQRYFREAHTQNFDTSQTGVYYIIKDGEVGDLLDWIALTRSQQIHHCEDEGWPCGN
jgi:RHS repeat-associated protein